MINTVIIKPTKLCNADCSYCCAPPSQKDIWDIEKFERVFKKIHNRLSDGATLLWHGGEPMLAGPAFYRKAFEIARKYKPGIRFSMQSNLLLYNSKQWKDVIFDVMGGSISTSFDLGSKERTIKGDHESYKSRFLRNLSSLVNDGFRPLVIGTYTEETANFAIEMYEFSKSQPIPIDIRINYRYPAGRAASNGVVISPKTFGDLLVTIYNKWLHDDVNMIVTPLDIMLKHVLGGKSDTCPWTNSCGGRILAIEPNGDVYNCGEFADLGGDDYRFGSIFDNEIDEILESKQSRSIRRRVYLFPEDCARCEHFQECRGGCARDAALFGNGIYGKFYYCSSWKTIFSRIKESVATGEANGLIERLGLN